MLTFGTESKAYSKKTLLWNPLPRVSLVQSTTIAEARYYFPSLTSRASNKHKRKANASIRSRTIIDHKFRFNLSAIKVTTRTSRRQEKKCPIHEKQSQLQTTSCRPNEKSEAAAKFALKGIDIPARIQVEEKSLWKFARLFFPQRLCWRERNKRSTKNAEFGNRVGASVHHVSYSNSFISKIDALPSKQNSGSIFTVKSPRSPSFLVFFLTVEMMFACKTRYTHPCWLGKISGYFVFRWQSAKCKRTTWLWRGVLEFGWHPHKRCHFDSVKSLIPWRGHPAQQLHILATGLVGGLVRTKVG